MTIKLLRHPFRTTEVLIKTGLSHHAIIAYCENICRIKGWDFTIANMGRAKEILDVMAIVECQHNMFLPLQFEEIYEKVKQAVINN